MPRHQSTMSPQPGAASEPPNCWTARDEQRAANESRSWSDQPASVPDDQARAEDVPGPGRVEGRDPQRGYGDLLAGRVVDGQSAEAAVRDDGEGYAVGQGVERVLGRVGAGVGHRLLGVGQEPVAVREQVEGGHAPLAGGVPADVGEHQGAVLLGGLDPRPRLLVADHLTEVDEDRAGRRRRTHQLRRPDRSRVTVGHHAAVATDRHRHGDRRVPVVEPPREAEVDVLLLLERAPAEVAVVVVTERRDEGGPQAEPAGRHGQVGDPARARAHALGPDLGPRAGDLRQAGEDDVEEDRAGQDHVEGRVARLSVGGQGVVCRAHACRPPPAVVFPLDCRHPHGPMPRHRMPRV